MGVNEPLPGQLTVKELREVLADQQPNALVAIVDEWNSSLRVLHATRIVKADGGPTVMLGSADELPLGGPSQIITPELRQRVLAWVQAHRIVRYDDESLVSHDEGVEELCAVFGVTTERTRRR